MVTTTMTDVRERLRDFWVSKVSARLRILGWVALLLGIVGVVTVVIQHRILLDRLDSEVEAALLQEAEEVRVLATGNNPETGEPFDENVAAIFDTFLERNLQGEGEALVTFINGRPYKATAAPYALGEDPELISRWGSVTQSSWGQTNTPEGELRYLAVPLTNANGTSGVFVVASFTGERLDEIASTTRIAAGTYAAGMILAVALAWFVAGRVFAPVRVMTDTARDLSQSDLSRRIPVPESNDEISKLAVTFNEMLDRLDEAFTVQRQFLDDAGHELRTPITIVRGHLELDPANEAERESNKELVLDELDRMSRMVDDLLVLARAENVDFLRRSPIDIDVFTQELFTKVQRLGDRDWQLSQTAHGVAVVDAQRLTQAMINLAENAIRHTGLGSTIRIGTAASESELSLWVEDEGPGIEAEDQVHIFERFAHGRGSDNKDGKAGLGLAIVSAVANGHGGRAEVQSSPGQGATFVMSLPLSEEVEQRQDGSQ